MKSITSNINRGKRIISWIVFGILILTFSSYGLQGADLQDEDPLRTRISLVCTQLENNQINVETQVRAKVERSYKGVKNAELEIYNVTDTSQILLKKELTDKEGKLQLIIDANSDLTIREDGYYELLIIYKGDDKHKASKKDMEFIPAYIEIETTEEDSIKLISINVKDLTESETSLEDIEVVVQIPRMFSNLPIATESTDEDGMVEIEFPNDLPGGDNGELNIIVKAEDTDEFASLQTQVTKNWGIPITQISENNDGELWSPNAPLWMVLVFAFLIALVWVHFGIIIYKLFLINKEGKAIIE